MRAASIEWTAVAELLVATQAKGVVLLLAVALAAVALRRGAAATRHWLWFLGMVGLLALPALGAVLPRWNVRVPAWAAALRTDERALLVDEPFTTTVAEASPDASTVDEVLARAPIRARAEQPSTAAVAAGPTEAPRASDAPASANRATEAPWASEAPAIATRAAEALAVSAVPPTRGPSLSSTAALLIALWGTGAVVLLGSLVASLLAVRRLSARSFDFPRGRVTELTEQMRLGMGIRSPLRVLRGEPGAMPMSWGVLRPVILLPEGAERWHNTRLVSVLLHELAHVKRRDCLTQILAEVALSLHWPNPLAWLGARRLRVEREHACDDAVVAAGARASEYAEELISLAQGFQPAPRTSVAAVAMARPVHLVGRIRALLQERRPRRLSAAAALTCAGLAAGLSAAVASLAASPAPASDAPPAVLPASAPAPRPHIAPPDLIREALLPSSPAFAAALAEAVPATRPHIEPPEPAWQALIPSGLAKLVSTVASTRQEATCGMATTGWEQNTSNSNDDSHRLRWSRPGCDVEVRVEGDVEFSSDFRDVARLGRGALLRVEEEDGRIERRLDVTPGAGGSPAYLYRVNGQEQPFDAAARTWFEGMLLQVFRRAGFMAEERVAAMLRSGGVDAVLQELEVLPSDYVFATYVRELFEQADVTAAQAVDLLNRATPRVESDYYMAEILGAVADRHLGSDQVLGAFLTTSATIESDYYRSEVLGRALQLQNLTPARVAEVLRAASGIGSDYYLAEVLRSIASRYTLQPELREVYLTAVESIESDHYRAEVLSTLLARNDLGIDEMAVVLEATSGVGSDHYRTEILQRIADRALPSDALRAAYLRAASGIGSDHYRSEALGYLLQRETLTTAQLQELLRSAGGIESDHYKAALLIDVLRRHRLEAAARDAFVEAMDSIGSTHYRGEVAQALLRSERGGI